MLDVPDVYARESEKAFTLKISLLEINCWNVWVRMTSCINFLSETIAASQCCCNHNGLETCAEKAKESSSQKTNWWVPSLLTWPFCFVPPLTSAWISTHRKLRIEKLECAVNLWCACAQCSGSINRTCFIFHGERINDFFFFFFLKLCITDWRKSEQIKVIFPHPLQCRTARFCAHNPDLWLLNCDMTQWQAACRSLEHWLMPPVCNKFYSKTKKVVELIDSFSHFESQAPYFCTERCDG